MLKRTNVRYNKDIESQKVTSKFNAYLINNYGLVSIETMCRRTAVEPKYIINRAHYLQKLGLIPMDRHEYSEKSVISNLSIKPGTVPATMLKKINGIDHLIEQIDDGRGVTSAILTIDCDGEEYIIEMDVTKRPTIKENL